MIINQIASGGGGGIDTFDATAYPEHILEGYTAYARGAKITGTFVPTPYFGSGRIDKYANSMAVSGNSYTGMALDLTILDNAWIEKIVVKLYTADSNVTLNIRAFLDKSIMFTQSGMAIGTDETEIVLSSPWFVAKSQTVIFEFLFSSPKNLLRRTRYLYSGTIWRIDQNHINTYAGTGYSETPYFGLIEYSIN